MAKKDVFSKDLKLDLEEINATEKLLNESFDFGEGLMKIEDSDSLKEEYDELKSDIKNKIENNTYEEPKVKKEVVKVNKRHNKYDYYRFRRLLRANSYFISEKTNDNDEVYYTRFYLSGCRKMAKKQTSKTVRKALDIPSRGNGYRRKVDYWWILF